MTTNTPSPAQEAAIQEGERIAAADEYFSARTWIMDTNDNRRIFEAGFDRAYALLSKLRAPVAELRIGVSATAQGATVCITQPHSDGSMTTIYSETHPIGDSVGRAALASAPVADERKEIAGVTLDGCLETLFRVGEHLGIDYAESRKQPGAPSGIYIKAIEDRVSQAMNAAREEAATLMDQTSRSSGATLIRALASAPASEDGLTAKQAWWAGYRAGKGLPPDTPRQDAVKVDISSARLVTHWPNGMPRDERDTASDPEGKLIHDPTEPLLAASAPVANERAAFEAVEVCPDCDIAGCKHLREQASLVLVPVEPTPEMLDAADRRIGTWQREESRAAYSAMVAAAPLASAPVAVESPMAKMAEALREKARQEQQDYQDRRNQATEWGPMPKGTEADSPTSSAPVAHVAGDEVSRHLEWAKDRSAWEMPVGTPVYYSVLASAPVADDPYTDVNAAMAAEYRRWIDYYHQGRDYDDFLKECVYGHKSAPVDISSGHSGAIDTSQRNVEQNADDRHDAAPQASEAVRDAGIAASEDADEKMREVLQWIVDDAASGGVAKLRPQQEKRARAALSAQPGAQKNGGSDAN